MRRALSVWVVLAAITFSLFINVAHAAVWAPADVTIIELKMTGSEMLVIENSAKTDLNLSNYLVEYFNKNIPTNFAVPTSTQQLPNLALKPGQAILLNSDTSLSCGVAAVVNLSFSLSDTSGYVMLAKTSSQPDGSIITTPQDHASWTSSTTGADLNKVPSNTTDPNAVWYRKLADGTWQQADLNGDCTILAAMITFAATPTYMQWANGDEAPAVIISLADDSSGSDAAFIPPADAGLAAPQITELLPNPNGTGTDSTDEFIEIYNPNSAPFDLSGFKLQTGTTTKHSYIIPAGTLIGGKAFMAFASADTGLTLSNTGGQAAILDPLGTTISQSDVYGTAKDGQAWALANGAWYWTTTPTPAVANKINQSTAAASSSKAKTTASKASSTGAVKGATTSTPSASAASGATSVPPLHNWTLAGVGAAALLYACYEYRVDLANYLARLRKYAASWRAAGK